MTMALADLYLWACNGVYGNWEPSLLLCSSSGLRWSCVRIFTVGSNVPSSKYLGSDPYSITLCSTTLPVFLHTGTRIVELSWTESGWAASNYCSFFDKSFTIGNASLWGYENKSWVIFTIPSLDKPVSHARHRACLACAPRPPGAAPFPLRHAPTSTGGAASLSCRSCARPGGSLLVLLVLAPSSS